MCGYGESGKLESGYSFEKIIVDLEVLIENLNWFLVNILGYFWIGKLVCIWVRKNLEIFKSMILVDLVFIGKMFGLFKVIFFIFYWILEIFKGMGLFNSFVEVEIQVKELGKYGGWSEF